MGEETIDLASNEIYVLEDFISEETNNLLLSYVNLDGDEGWQSRGLGTTESSDSLTEFFYEEGDKIENRILDLFNGAEHLHLSSMRKIRRLTPGEFIHGHKDLGSYGNDFEIRYGAILYLNDDFEGGELYYKDLDIKIKPKKNSLLIHKSTIYHEVLPVTSGVRYSMTTFLKGDSSTKFIAK